MTISSSVSPIVANPPIHPRFVVLDVLAAADFGWGYLVKDLHCSGEQWVLEEFLPSPETPDNLVNVQNALRSALEPLELLQHPQLARSQDIVLLGDRLFWLREYVPGIAYRTLLDQRLQQGMAFTEAEVRSLLAQILPVLTVLHQQQIFHHQIDLHTIVRRQSDQLPVMTRFGEMRDLGMAAGFYLLRPLRSWSVEAGLEGVDRDLHDLAYVALVLITGEDEPTSLSALVQAAVEQSFLSPGLAAILDRMLIPKPWQRFQSADQVLTAIAQLELPTAMADEIALAAAASDDEDMTPSPDQRDPLILILSLIFVALMAIALWRIATAMPPMPNLGLFKSPSSKTPTPASKMSTSKMGITPDQNAASDRAEKLGISAELLDRLRQELPQADDRLNQQLDRLSEEARNGMGTYYRRDYERWFATLAAMKISGPTIDVLADTLLYLRFPELQGKTLNPRTLGQLWYAIARDQITALHQKKNIEILKAGTFNQSGKLSQGQSRVFQVQVQPGQSVELKLEGDMAALRLSVIDNEIVLLRYANQTQWAAPKSLRGSTYEIILTPMGLDAVDYQLRLSSR
jgi:serine/threonine protein kinase, bacterial